jgi:hypothetical protein
MSNEQRDVHEMQCRIGNESGKGTTVTCATVPILPLRYSVHPRPRGSASSYSYTDKKLPLETGFRALSHMQYGLRHVGGGFVYLFNEGNKKIFLWRANEDGTFSIMSSGYRSLGSKLEDYKFDGHTYPWIWAEKDSTVHIVLTDSLLTYSKLIAIQNNTGNIRDKLATTIDLSAWTADSPTPNTFPANQIGDLVEEYRQPGKLGFSPRKAFLDLKVGNAPQKAKALADATGGHMPIAAVMYDHVALVQDMTGIIYQEIRELVWYTTPPNELSEIGVDLPPEREQEAKARHRRKIIAGLIEQVYESAYAQEKKIKEPEELEKRILKDIGKGDADSFHTRRSKALTAQAENYVRHIKEDERVNFLTKFDADVKRLHKVIVDYKNDRCLWLDDYFVRNSRTRFGAVFLRYDTDGEAGKLPPDKAASRTFHALAFASCVESMVWGMELSGVEDRERKCFEKWMGTETPEKNPLLINMDYDNGIDERLIAWGLYEGGAANAPLGITEEEKYQKYQKELEAAQKSVHKAQQEAEAAAQKFKSAEENARRKAEAAKGVGKEAQKAADAAAKTAREAEVLVKEAGEILKQAQATEAAAAEALNRAHGARGTRLVAMNQLLEQTRVYVVSRRSRQGMVYKGSVRNKVAGYIQKLADGRIRDVNAEKLVELLEKKYGNRLALRVMTEEDVLYCLANASNSPYSALVRGSFAKGMGEQMEVLFPETASIEELKKATQEAQEQEALARKLEREARELNARKEALEQKAEAKRAEASTLEGPAEQQRQQADALRREAGKLQEEAAKAGKLAEEKLAQLGKGKEAAAQALKNHNPFLSHAHLGVSSLLTALAVWNLKNAVDTFAKEHRWVNIAALFAATATLGSALNALAGTRWMNNAVAGRALHPLAIRTYNAIAGIVALRLFGYGAAAFDGITYTLRAKEQYEAGNERAGDLYAGAAIGLALGGAAVTAGVAAVVAAGTGLATLLLGIPVWGWIAAGMLMLGVGIYCLFEGDDARFGPMNFWLNACVFGKHDSLSQDDLSYTTLEAELAAFHSAAFGPQLTDKDWDNTWIPFTEDSLEVTLVYPLPGSEHKLSVQGHALLVNLTKTELSAPRKHVYQIGGLNKIERLILIASYTPENSTLGTLTLKYPIIK